MKSIKKQQRLNIYCLLLGVQFVIKFYVKCTAVNVLGLEIFAKKTLINNEIVKGYKSLYSDKILA